MKTSFDIVLLLFTTCIVTGFKQFSSFFQNTFQINYLFSQALQNDQLNDYKKDIQYLKTIFQLIYAEYIFIIFWLIISLYLEIILSARGKKDMQQKPQTLLKLYTCFSIGLLIFEIITSIIIRNTWTIKYVRNVQTTNPNNYPLEFQEFILALDGLMPMNFIFQIGLSIFILFVIFQVWKEKTVNEFNIIRDHSGLIITSKDGQTLQKYNFLPSSVIKKCKVGSNLTNDDISCIMMTSMN